MDISPIHQKIVLQILENNLPPESTVWLFGSRATKAKKKYSDLDLAIDSKNILPLSVMASLEHDFSESDLPYRVDVIDLNAISDSFREAIRSSMVLIWRN